MVRISGELAPLPVADPLTPDDTAQALREMLRDPARTQEMETEGEADFAYAVPGLARFRVNAFRQRGSISIVCRRIPYGVTTIAELGLPDAVREMAEEPRGIVLVTGTTGSGKSTTLAAMVDHVNTIAARHIVTIEDPIEFLHSDKRSVINQREVGSDTGSFSRALRRVLRQDPDIILIGEMRDEETVRTALSAAETGHLVLSTLHTADAPETINRVIDFFPPHHHRQVRAMLSATLRGVISQRLVPALDGGRVAALEILRTTGRVRDAIMDPDQTAQLPGIIAEGVFYGMQTFDQALFEHVKAGQVTREHALAAASSPQDFKLLLAAEGRVGTSMDEVFAQRQPASPEPVAGD
jgi:twitching motility protein PilT